MTANSVSSWTTASRPASSGCRSALTRDQSFEVDDFVLRFDVLIERPYDLVEPPFGEHGY